MHFVSARCLSQQKQFCKLSVIHHCTSTFFFVVLTKKLLAAHSGLMNELDLLTLRFKHTAGCGCISAWTGCYSEDKMTVIMLHIS